MATATVEVVYRGIFQKHLAQRVCRGIVLAARKEGKIGIAFGRYGDSPERNGIPAKQFAVVSDNEEELQAFIARYEPDSNDVTVVLDDTLSKGVESWAWYGLQPINKLTKPGGTVLFPTMVDPEDLIPHIHKKGAEYQIAVVKAATSFSGLWVYKDDHTDVRLLGALPKLAPHLVSLASIEKAILEEWGDELKVTSARKSYERVTVRKVAADEGNPEVPFSFTLPKWQELKEGLVIPAIKVQQEVEGWDGGYRPGRNETFKKFTTRSMRPVVDFAKCTKCTLCWLQCPDSCFDVTPDGYYDANMEACCGCGVCEAVCPVEACVTMVNEQAFTDNASQWDMWKKDGGTYATWIEQQRATVGERSHGFRFRGQYQEELAKAQAAGEGGTAR